MVVSSQGLRRGVDGDGPAIGNALLVDPLAEVPDEQIAAHLEVGDSTLEVFLSSFSESGLPLQIRGKPLLLLQKAVHDPLLTHGGLLVLPAAVEVIAVSTPVGKVREPGFGDKTGSFAEKIAVGHPAAAGDESAPLPGVLVRVSGPPIESCGVLLRGEAVHLVFEQGQEADLIDPADEFLPALDTGRVVPVHASYDPFAVFNGHSEASPPSFMGMIIAHLF